VTTTLGPAEQFLAASRLKPWISAYKVKHFSVCLNIAVSALIFRDM